MLILMFEDDIEFYYLGCWERGVLKENGGLINMMFYVK